MSKTVWKYRYGYGKMTLKFGRTYMFIRGNGSNFRQYAVKKHNKLPC